MNRKSWILISTLSVSWLFIAIGFVYYRPVVDKGFLNNYWRDSWTILGFIVSAIGSALSVWAVIEATGARKAAETARNEIIKKRMVFSGEEANHAIDIIDRLINQRKYELAEYLLSKLANDFSRLANLAHQHSNSSYEDLRVYSVQLTEWRLKCINHSGQTKFEHLDEWVRFTAEVKPKLNNLSQDYEGL